MQIRLYEKWSNQMSELGKLVDSISREFSWSQARAGSMTGTVGNRCASGTCNTTCGGADSASGGWVVKW